ncbi:MAG: VCBS repeat-containing protein [Dehalococcoidales bacterium]|nr:VCBS repeat-containing protein [Dehalococcoidales bacterium]
MMKASTFKRLLRTTAIIIAICILLLTWILPVPFSRQLSVISANGGPGVNSLYFGTGSDATCAVAYGDLNGDGYPDIAVGNAAEQNVVYFGNSSGGFDDSAGFGTGVDWTCSIALGDMDNDSHLDIVVGNFFDQNVIYLNDGSGGFDTSVDFGTGWDGTDSLALGDMDNDGYLDIVVGNSLDQNAVYFNDGFGGFDTSVNFSTGFDDTYTVAVGDVNGDTYPDIAIGNSMEQNAVYINDQSRGFGTDKNFGTGIDDTRSIALGDVDGDTDLDLVAGNYFGQNVVYFNDGSGNFTPGVNFGTGSDATWPVTPGDVDSDGDIDIAAGNVFQQNVVYINDGSGHFNIGVNFGIGAEDTESIVLGDIDSDTDLDIITGNSYQQNVIYLNLGIEINLKQDTTDLSGSYDFGDVKNGGSLDVIFTIENQGTWDLTLTTPLIVTGADSGQFNIEDQPDSNISGAESTDFTVRFSPTTLGGKNAAISITNNDADENPYVLNIQGNSLPAPEMEVTGNSLEIVCGDSTPNLSDHTDFGGADVSGGEVVRTFTINNNAGTDVLNLTGDPLVAIEGDPDFSLTAAPATPVPIGNSTAFQVTFSPQLLGQRTANITIANDDPSENPYTFAIQGMGTTTEINLAPAQPSNLSPEDGAEDLILKPTLEASVFSDPNTGDFHSASQWQVTTIPGNYSSPVFDSGLDTSNKEDIEIPSGILKTNTQYYWHARYQDYNSTWSEWSVETSYSTGNIIYVPDDEGKIQYAVNAASAGDTVMVRDGTYTENVTVDKQVTIQSENGADLTVVQAKKTNEPVCKINTDHVTVVNLTFTDGDTGIHLDSVDHCTICGNNCHHNYDIGIYLINSGGNTISGNTCAMNGSGYVSGGVGLYMCQSPGDTGLADNTVSGNTFNSNLDDGIWIFQSNDMNNIIENNMFINDGLVVDECSNLVVTGNTVNGLPLIYRDGVSNEVIDGVDAGQVVLNGCTSVTVKNLYITGTDNAILLENCSLCRVYHNNCSSNTEAGIFLTDSDNNTIYGNTGNSNGFSGIFLWDSSSNTIYSNICNFNSYSGLLVNAFATQSNDNYFYLNNLNNYRNIYFDEFGSALSNTWHSPEEMTYLYSGGTYSGYLGNYYSDYYGSDENGDGVGDTDLPYITTKGGEDSYPLVSPALTMIGITAGKVYDGGTTAVLDTTGAWFLGLTEGDSVDLVTTSATGIFADKNVGMEKPVTVTGLDLSGADAGQYIFVQPVIMADITAKELTVSGITAENKVYDGNTTAALDTSAASLVGVVTGETVDLDVSGASGAFEDAAAGSGKTVNISGLTISGDDAVNYTLTQPTAAADITAKALTVSGITAENKVYDGNTTAALNTSTAFLAGVIGDDIVTLNTSSATGTFAGAGVGEDIQVTVSGLTIQGAEAGNYSVTQPTATADITPAAPVFSNLGHPAIQAGTLFTTLGGTISCNSLYPTGDVIIILNGVTQPAPVNALNGNFSSVFYTMELSVPGSPYSISYGYPGDANFSVAGPDTSRYLTVIPAVHQSVGGEVNTINKSRVLVPLLAVLVLVVAGVIVRLNRRSR